MCQPCAIPQGRTCLHPHQHNTHARLLALSVLQHGLCCPHDCLFLCPRPHTTVGVRGLFVQQFGTPARGCGVPAVRRQQGAGRVSLFVLSYMFEVSMKFRALRKYTSLGGGGIEAFIPCPDTPCFVLIGTHHQRVS